MYVGNNNNANVLYKSVSQKQLLRPNIYAAPQVKQTFVPLNIKAPQANIVPISVPYPPEVTLTPRFAVINSEQNNITSHQPLKMQLYQTVPNKTSQYLSTNTISPPIVYIQKPTSTTSITEISNHAPVFVSEPYIPGEINNNTFENGNQKKNVNAFYYSN
jgi:hypothetical protein